MRQKEQPTLAEMGSELARAVEIWEGLRAVHTDARQAESRARSDMENALITVQERKRALDKALASALPKAPALDPLAFSRLPEET